MRPSLLLKSPLMHLLLFQEHFQPHASITLSYLSTCLSFTTLKIQHGITLPTAPKFAFAAGDYCAAGANHCLICLFCHGLP